MSVGSGQLEESARATGRSAGEGKRFRSHQVAYELANECCRSLHVLHSCDNPSCCNPAHLREGTNSENVDDRMLSGRDADRSGELNGRHRLTARQVRAIRRAYRVEQSRRNNRPGSRRRVTQRSLARQYGVSSTAIQFVLKGRNWKPARERARRRGGYAR